jgi:hypothetical protein
MKTMLLRKFLGVALVATIPLMTGCAASADDLEEEDVDSSEEELSSSKLKECGGWRLNAIGGSGRTVTVRLILSRTHIVGYDIYRNTPGAKESFERVTTPDHYRWHSPDNALPQKWYRRNIAPISRRTSSVDILANVDKRFGWDKACTIRFNGRTDY